MGRPTIYDAAGGATAFLRLAAAHHARCLADPVLEHPFSHGTRPDHVERLAAYWAEVFGGPSTFSDELSDQGALVQIHAHTDAEAAMGTNFLTCFLAALDDADIPGDRQLRTALADYMAWAVAQMMSYAPKGAPLPSAPAVPRWTWHGLAEA
ncbi:hypothetical protein KSP35_14175 [Aquihabitans sp. G128]|uniref:globin domain-containing protein n=1 Tax=Aquihabitans sp. G128 TaxID=2849779 RepID=UPI001C238CCC|nr:hypothetical protein [Aquihabitans sp. G128]QXC59531.1 hypothetical protein KSP35_14175 [Aquihabitans sp. G128]